jgi:hypothetical protein
LELAKKDGEAAKAKLAAADADTIRQQDACAKLADGAKPAHKDDDDDDDETNWSELKISEQELADARTDLGGALKQLGAAKGVAVTTRAIIDQIEGQWTRPSHEFSVLKLEFTGKLHWRASVQEGIDNRADSRRSNTKFTAKGTYDADRHVVRIPESG